MKTIDLNVKTREAGSKIAEDLRRHGFVPANFYAYGVENINVYAKALDLRTIVYTSHKPLVNLHIDDNPEPKKCIVKEIVFDPVTEQITHIDFLGLVENHTLTTELPIVLKGTPEGIRLGGKLQQVLHKIKIKTTPEFLSDSIEIDISQLEIGKSVYVRDIQREGWKISLPPDTMICSLKFVRQAAS
ncbi:MAG: 50S ribosomal protein L25 [Chloroherpetonaceae bacterium]|jgi:large subunit ribosomal protein L25|nr:50S ribosomal protein L25 [bacterium]